MDECKPLPATVQALLTSAPAASNRSTTSRKPCWAAAANGVASSTRGLHSFTLQLNVALSVGQGVRLGVIQGVYRVCYVPETAQVDLRSGRV